MYNKIESLNILKKLVENFKKHEKEYSKESYLELSVRSEFIDIFFSALNWDIVNSKNLPPSECEVVRENHVSDENNKRVDYTFKIGGGTKFAVEAKKPSENLNNPDHIFQAKSYAFSMNTNLVILTNFKEFKLFDLQVKPLHSQHDTDLVKEYSFSYLDIIHKFDKIWDLMEYNNVSNGSLEKFYFDNRKGLSKKQIDESLKAYNKKGASLLDKSFLSDLLIWRLKLAENIYALNKTKDVKLLNESVQRLIDRIIFLRILEDKRIEGCDKLFALCRDWKNKKTGFLKENLEKLFETLNQKYNGLIFKYHEYIAYMKIDDAVLYDFIFSLYVPQSPYNFAIIEVDILGKIFEQYLGHTISIENNKVQLIFKNENKKSTGIYYTRQEIVSRIVNETILPEINQINNIEDLEKYKILDMACGSGSFVIEAFRAVVTRYQDIINDLPNNEKNKYLKKFYYDDSKVYLTMQYKKEIVQKNIFGVDIDPQAIEIAKMSMYILMLEMNYKDDSMRPILPTLDDNFKEGNSLVSSDFYVNNAFDIEIDKIANPFDYKSEFIDVFETGGFNAVIGNPPYVKIQTLNKNYPQSISDYINSKFPNTAIGNYDLYVIFIEKAISLLADNGKLGMIVLNNFFTSDYGKGLRKLLSEKEFVIKIVNFGELQVFDNSQVYTCLLYLKKTTNKKFFYEKVENYEDWKSLKVNTVECINESVLTEQPWYFGDDLYNYLCSKVFSNCQTLDNFTKLFAGVQPTTNDVYLVEIVESDEHYYYCRTKKYPNTLIKLEKLSVKPIVKGARDIKAYNHKYNIGLIFPYEMVGDKSIIIDEKIYSIRFPETYKYLSAEKDKINAKHKKIKVDSPWYRYEYVKNHTLFEQPKILVPAMMFGSRFSLDEIGQMYITCGGASSGGGNAIIFKSETDGYNFYSLLAILNSFIVSYLIVRNGVPKQGGWQGVDKRFIEKLYFPKINNNKEKQDILLQLEKYSKDLIFAVQESENSTKESEMQRIGKRISLFKNTVNELVRSLYGIDDKSYSEILEYLKDYL